MADPLAVYNLTYPSARWWVVFDNGTAEGRARYEKHLDVEADKLTEDKLRKAGV